jgi:lysocardiolipin and lysophospholipid acyltransferase
MANVALLLEFLFGVEMVFHGNKTMKQYEKQMQHPERAIWICNHRTRIDWMLLWSLAFRTRTLDQLHIVLKGPLRKAPIFGWAMQFFLFIFLVSC